MATPGIIHATITATEEGFEILTRFPKELTVIYFQNKFFI
jgi:hypothetical protein|tara:strand:+ start:1366 stop:1485 length:120 start_codon:yes stop_codon:yes gene_type:complete